MVDKAFLNGLANGKTDIIQKLFDIIAQNNIAYCVIGGLAVNAYVEPVVSLDLDFVVAMTDFDTLKKVAAQSFEIKEFPHSLNLYSPDSDIRIQIQTDDRYQSFVERAEKKQVLGYEMRVASLADVLQGKIWAYSDTQIRKSKRQKDLADIYRIIESFPDLETMLPEDLKDNF